MNAKKQRKDQTDCFNDTIGVPSPSLDAPLNDITMPSYDSSRIDYEV